MAENLTYGITLESGKLVSSAEAAASALDELNASIKADQQDVAAMSKSLKLLGTETAANRDHVKRLKDSIDVKRKAISGAALDVQRLGGAYGFVAKKPANDFRSRLQEIGKDAKDAGGPLGRVAAITEKMAKAAGTSTGKFALMSAGLAAVGVAAGVAAMKAFGFAQELAEARDKELRDLGGFLSLQSGVQDFQKDSQALQGIIGKIAHNAAASREEVGSVAKELIKAGISGRQLETALEAANMASVVAGADGVKQFIEQSKAAKAHGKSVESVAASFRTKFGPSAKAALLSNEALAKRAKDNFASLFEGVDFEPLQKAKRKLIDLFDASTPLGKALHNSIKPWLQGMADFFTGVTNFAADFVVDWIIGVKQMQISYLDLKLGLKGFSHSLFMLGYEIADWVEKKGKKLAEWVQDVKLAWQQFDAKQLGMDIINGILAGLIAGWEALKRGITQLGNDISAAFKSVLGIASPSKVFTELGKQLPRGLEVGIKAEQPSVDRAVADMVTVPMNSVPRAQSAAPTITISAPITIESRGDITQDIASLEAQLAAALSRVAQQLGAAVAA